MSTAQLEDIVKRLTIQETGKSPVLPALNRKTHINQAANLAYCPDWAAVIYPANASSSVEPKSKYEAACTLRDSLDHYTNGPIYAPFLSRVMPLIINILRGPCIFQNTSLEQVSSRHRAPRAGRLPNQLTSDPETSALYSRDPPPPAYPPDSHRTLRAICQRGC